MSKYKIIPIGFIDECFSCNPESGEVFWKERPQTHFPSTAGRNITNGKLAKTKLSYISGDGRIKARVKFLGQRYAVGAHNIVFALTHKRWPTNELDHIDNNPLNNRLVNLREATRSENICNRGKFKGDMPKNIRVARNGFAVQIKKNAVQFHLGTFKTLEEAIKVKDIEIQRLHGEFAR